MGGVGGAGGVGGGNRGQINGGNRADIGNGNRQVNGGNRNNGNFSGNTVNRNNNININNDGGWGGWNDYHPIAAGVAIGAVAGVTAAAIGSAYYALPHGCAPYPYGGYSYYSCGGAYYEPQYQGDTVVYVTVPAPGSTASTTTVTTQ